MYNQTHNTSWSYPYPACLEQRELELEGSNMGGYCPNYSSSSSSYGGSPTSNSMGAFESLSLVPNHGSSSSNPLHVLLPEDSSQNAPVRRVYSYAGSSSPLSTSNENSLIIQGILKAPRYTPEQKQERIERYRTKRNQRNFHKKIHYTCRKTLADSRPRIKGRFVRNDGVSTSPVTTANATSYMTSTTDADYTTTSHCYEGGYSLLINDQHSSVHHHDQQQSPLEGECEEINYNWVNLFD